MSYELSKNKIKKSESTLKIRIENTCFKTYGINISEVGQPWKIGQKWKQKIQ